MGQMGIERILGIALSFAAMMWGAMNFHRMGDPRNSLLFDVSVWFGLVLGNYFYVRLWLAEGRDRERRRQMEARERGEQE